MAVWTGSVMIVWGGSWRHVFERHLQLHAGVMYLYQCHNSTTNRKTDMKTILTPVFLGALAIGSAATGVATAGLVYQKTPATARASWGG